MKRTLAFLALVRPLMLPTAISDAFLGTGCAGLVFGSVVGWDILFYASAMSLLLYASGMVMNDLFDAADDAKAGRKRPIAMGSISFAAGWMLLIVLLVSASVVASFLPYPAIILYAACLTVIFLYNISHKKYVVLSPFLMGGARSLSLLGAAAAFGVWGDDLFENRVVLAIAISYGLYVTAVTFFSLLEDKIDDPGYKLSAVFAALLAVAALIPLLQDEKLRIYFFLFGIVVLSFLISMFYLLFSATRRKKLGSYTPLFITPLLLLGGMGLFILSVGDTTDQFIVPSVGLGLCYPLLSLFFYIRAERKKVEPVAATDDPEGEV